MCELLADASNWGVGLIICGAMIGAIPIILWAFRVRFPLGAGVVMICIGVVLAAAFAIMGAIFSSAAAASCRDKTPTQGSYKYDTVMGYAGQPNAPRLVRIDVTESEITFRVVYHNAGKRTETLRCPDSPAEVNGAPSVEFGSNPEPTGGTAQATDYFCRGREGSLLRVKPGKTLVSWASFETDWRFGRPFSLWWYGNEVQNLRLPS